MLFWFFYLGPLLTLPIAMAFATLPPGFSWRQLSKETRFLVGLCGVSFLGFGLEVIFNIHYAAPLAGLVILLVLLAMKRVRQWEWRGKTTGLLMSRSVPAITCAILVLCIFARPFNLALAPSKWKLVKYWYSPWKQEFGRQHILEKLNSYPGKHLVIVRYQPGHDTIAEWVYNGADIDASNVVWAHDMGAANNEELLKYYANRRVWLVQADTTPPTLTPYAETQSATQ
jgi:hypothetical protein